MKLHIIRKVAIIFLLIITIFGTVQVFATNEANNNENTSENGIVSNEVAGQLVKVKEHTKKEIQDKIDLYGSEAYGMTAYILEKVRLYSIPLCFIGIAVGAIFQYVIGIRKLDLRDRGLKLVVAFITILVICQVVPLVFAIVVRGWRG